MCGDVLGVWSFAQVEVLDHELAHGESGDLGNVGFRVVQHHDRILTATKISL